MTLRIDMEAVPPAYPLSGEQVENVLLSVGEAFSKITECPYEWAADVFFASEDEIRDMNREMRGIDKVTDVLSFPAASFPEKGSFGSLEEDPASFDPDTGELILGDIALCFEKIMAQAEEYGHSVRREMAYLTAHSLLHLIGYDHMEPEEEKEMTCLQERILQECGIHKETEQDRR